MKSLYNITDDMEKVNDLLCESGGEITEEINELIKTTSADLQNKIDNVVDYMGYLESCLSVVSEKKKQIQNLEKSYKNQIENFKSYVLNCMHKVNLKKIESPLNRITIPKRRAVVAVSDESKIPMEFFNHVPEQYVLDKVRLKKALESGEKIEGAYLEDGKESILIKSKGVK